MKKPLYISTLYEQQRFSSRIGILISSIFIIITANFLGITVLNLYDAIVLPLHKFYDSKIMSYIYEIIPFFIALIEILILIKIVDRLSPFTIGFSKKNIIKMCLLGGIIGILLCSLFILLLTFMTHVTIVKNTDTRFDFLILMFFGFIIQSTTEEVLFRGWIFSKLWANTNIYTAVFLNSLLFALMHLDNKNISLLYFVAIFLFGFLMSLFMIVTNNLLFVSFAHGLWNFCIGGIWGIDRAKVFTSIYQTIVPLYYSGNTSEIIVLLLTIVVVLFYLNIKKILLFYSK